MQGAEPTRGGRDASRAAVADPLSIGFYVINLDRSSRRWDVIRQAFGELPWPLERVAALDAATETQAVLEFRGQTLAHPPDGIDWNPLRSRMFSVVEEAVFCSHLRALQRFLASDRDYAVMMEDDAQPRRNVARELQDILSSGVRFDILKLEGFRHLGARPAVEEARIGTVALVRSLKRSSGAAGYLVTREAARKLIENAGRRPVPFDDYLSNPGLNGCSILHVSPYLLWQSGDERTSTMTPLRTPVLGVRLHGTHRRVLPSLRRVWLIVRMWQDALFGPYRAPIRIVQAPWY